MKFPTSPQRIRRLAALPLATAAVVGTFLFFQSASRTAPAPNPERPALKAPLEKSTSEGLSVAGGVTAPSQSIASQPLTSNAMTSPSTTTATTRTTATTSGTQASDAAERKPLHWKAEFRISEELKPAQRANFGERDQILGLASLAKVFPKWSPSRLCVRAQGKPVAFDRESGSEDRIRIRGGSGRIRPDSRIEVSYCSSAAAECAACTVIVDEFEGSLFGESAEDSAENEDADVTAQLSAEVRRELARLDRDSAPAPITAWAAIQDERTRTGGSK